MCLPLAQLGPPIRRMCPQSPALVLGISAVIAGGSMPVEAVELPVRDGLVLWLDATEQPALRSKATMRPLSDRQGADVWLDSSPARQAALQPLAERRPQFYGGSEAAFFRFDGKDDFFTLTGPRKLAPSATVFVLAAPKANPGQFSALFACAEAGKNDYTSGLNLDQGNETTPRLSVVNLEGAGSAGFRDLLGGEILGAAERPFGGFHVFTVRSRIAKGGNEFFLDSVKAGGRDRLESNIGLDQIAIGSRWYSNDPAQFPFAQGFFAGDLAAVAVYDRSLTDAEREAVEKSLLDQSARLHALAAGTKGHALETLAEPPVIQVLVPGFTVRELPLRIGNINNIRYRHDGRAVALGYDGRIHTLSDTDGDGLEDKADLYWDKKTMRGAIGMVLAPKGDARGEGVFVGSKGKVSFFPDRNGDGKADEEKVIASGWKESFHGVDTVGLAMDKDGALYFGLGCANFAEAYLIDKNTGKAGYDIKSHHGTIQRLSPDFAKREALCTGVRFTCALAFNKNGDLFASEQEGATWMPNGNPFDELLHIQPGLHYGFPPRHPKHLPGVRDEPAVIEYGPQHQSTVGMVFNESVNGGPAFGPAHWAGDVLMCGESRGKLWRTKLAKTPLGYVAENHLLACMNLLLVDACVTPQGDLLVACHSGPPDWGTGPAGEGRLFKISYTGKTLPQPVRAWAAAPDEFHVAFDRPLDPADWREAREKIRIEAGKYVGAGDRFETVRPGYQVVREQMAAPRRWVNAIGLALSEDQRTISVRVAPQTAPDFYALTLPAPEAWKQPGGIAQHPQIDILVSLNGVQATVRAGVRELSGILPHASAAVSRVLTEGSAGHTALLDLAAAAGSSVALRGFVDPSNPFTPTVQPGSKLDWDPTSDPFYSTHFKLAGEFRAPSGALFDSAGSGRLKPLTALTTDQFGSTANGIFLTFTAADYKDLVFLRGGNPKTADSDALPLSRPLTPQRLFVPWTSEPGANPSTLVHAERTDVKGRWLEGRRLFFGEAACFTCHSIRGEGMAFGPDLGNLIHRDRDSVLKDILQPSATINPDQAGSALRLHDGTVVQGIVRAANDATIKLALPAGAELAIEKAKVAGIEPLKNSLMTEGYADRLTKEQQEDLLTFLLINAMEPAPITRTEPPMPPPRTRAEVAAVMPAPPSATQRAQWKPLRILLSGGAKDHGVDEHDYPLWLQRWSRLLGLADKVTVTTCQNFPTEQQLAAADVVVFYSNNAGWNENAATLLDAYQQRGGGLVYLHWGIEGHKHALPLAERAGLAFSMSKFRHGEVELQFTQPEHPITRGFKSLRFVDESYWRLHGDPKRLAILANSLEDNAPQPQLWAYERGRSRVFGCIPGHYTWTFDDPLYRLLVLRSIAWAARDPDIERLAELSLPGARLQP